MLRWTISIRADTFRERVSIADGRSMGVDRASMEKMARRDDLRRAAAAAAEPGRARGA